VGTFSFAWALEPGVKMKPILKLNLLLNASLVLLVGLATACAPEAKFTERVETSLAGREGAESEDVTDGHHAEGEDEDEETPAVEMKEFEIAIYEEIRFVFGKADLTASAKELLNVVADTIHAEKKHIRTVRIEGHTDSVGSAQDNMLLSQARAKSVFKYLVSRGIPASMLTHEGFGESVLKNPADPESPENRRVEFKIDR
jgi:outer membrane protein OmpA-like peptidoglycan-associated protein